MADQDESAKLWKVNRTIHELVKDRVSAGDPSANFFWSHALPLHRAS